VSKARGAQAAATRGRRAWLPPRWFVLLFWHGHRALLTVDPGAHHQTTATTFGPFAWQRIPQPQL
jgi:hypothetical protein